MRPVCMPFAVVPLVSVLLGMGGASRADERTPGRIRPVAEDATPMPRIEGPWWQIAGDPDLGKYTSPRQQPVDFGIWQAADGSWQLWSCIRHTKCGGSTRLFHRWQGRTLTQANWKPMGIAMEADAKFGETPGGLQAPHVIRHDGVFHMFYGDWRNICLATSSDGKAFTRRLGADGKAGMFTSGGNTQDPMVLHRGGKFYCYYTAHPGGQGADYCRTSTDLRTWSDAKIVARGGAGGTGAGSAECPHVIFHEASRHYYLFRTQRYGADAQTRVYASVDPMGFGTGGDGRFVGTLPVAAPEIIVHDGRYYLGSLMPNLKGIRLARLRWAPRPPRPVRGEGLFDFDAPKERAAWRVVAGKIEPVFTTSRRQNFNPPYRHFIGTAESARGGPDDAQMGAIESPAFVLERTRYIALVSGGTEAAKVHVALVDAKTGKELLRWVSRQNTNTFQEHVVDTTKHVGARVRIRVVDRATGGWGHVNFGGLFAVETRGGT